MNSGFKLLLYIMKLNLKRITSFVVSILVTSCENRQFANVCDVFPLLPATSKKKKKEKGNDYQSHRFLVNTDHVLKIAHISLFLPNGPQSRWKQLVLFFCYLFNLLFFF